MSKTTSLLAMCLFLVIPGFVAAETIVLDNPSFEEPVLGPGGWNNANIGWGDDLASSGAEFTEHIVGFVDDGFNHAGLNAGAEIAQDTGFPILPNAEYTLKVAIGNRNTNFSVRGNESRISLYTGGYAQDGGILVASSYFDASFLAEGTFADLTLTYNSPDVPPTGNLWISLQSTGEQRAHFDNVRLDGPVIPEPTTLAMMLTGLIGLIGFARRRR